MTNETQNVSTALKKQALRNNEYYSMQAMLDRLYELGKKEHYNFHDLMQYISAKENILLAYRNIKRNKGSKTKGSNKTTILDLAETNQIFYVQEVQKRLKNYYPNPVRRVEIPKGNGKTRPLGIPTMEDRIGQQCIKQILEPILEAKFYPHSYGFRPNRSTHHAIARLEFLAFEGYYYVVDVDIKGFFDNVNHGKLIKQLWSIGIQDKNLIKILSRMLKAEIVGIGKPEKGTPQGGILSPLLANVVLNELDWWIDSQWCGKKLRHPFGEERHKIRAMKKTKLKDIRIVRYADDFKILCKDHETARRIFWGTKKWLKERLKLEVSAEKSKITNLRRNYSDFLGFKIKLNPKQEDTERRKYAHNYKYTNTSHISDKAKQKIKDKLKQKIRDIKKSPTYDIVNKFNGTVLSLQFYYKIATMVSHDFRDIAYSVNKSLKCRTKEIRAETGKPSKTYDKYYGNYKQKQMYIADSILYPVSAVKFSAAKMIMQERCDYTEIGRTMLHKGLELDISVIYYLMNNPMKGRSVEWNDNRISLYSGQQGKCYVTGKWLEIGNMEVHHRKPIKLGGTDEYKNLAFVTSGVHQLIHATQEDTIGKYLEIENLDDNGFKKLNKLRALVGNNVI